MRVRYSIFFLAIPAATVLPAAEWQKLPALPNHTGVASPFAGVSNGALIVAGGANFPDKMPWEGGKKVWHDDIWILDKPDGAWRSAGKLPRPLAYGISVTVNNSVLCAGGSDANKHYADVFELHWKDGKLECWKQSPPLPIPLALAAGAVTSEDVVYIACGSTEPGEKHASNRIFTSGLHWKDRAWREIPALPAEPRILPCAAAHGKNFYLFGGAALGEENRKIVRRYLRDAWQYSEAGGWKRLAFMPRRFVAAATPAPVVVPANKSKDKDTGALIYLIAGDDGTKAGTDPVTHPGFPKTILCYNTATNTWTEAGETPAPRATVPCVKWNNSFVLPSGEVRPGVRSAEVWAFTPPDKSK